MSNASSISEPKVLLDGLAYVESPRWHEGRLWFAHWGTGEIVAVDLAGHSEVTGHGPAGLGWSIDFGGLQSACHDSTERGWERCE